MSVCVRTGRYFTGYVDLAYKEGKRHTDDHLSKTRSALDQKVRLSICTASDITICWNVDAL